MVSPAMQRANRTADASFQPASLDSLRRGLKIARASHN
jgi:hypothetical protein